METANDAIIKKIRGLLAVAKDNCNDNESQSAFLMAQKLMIKNRITLSMVEDSDSIQEEIQKVQVTAFKTLFWWERTLAQIISKNFRVKNYTNSIYEEIKGKKKKVKRAIFFYGFEEDVSLAKEMFVLAYDALSYYSSNYIDSFYNQRNAKRSIAVTNKIKNSYMNGFLIGMEEKFNIQVTQMEQEYGLTLLVPVEVKASFDEFTKEAVSLKFSIPQPSERTAFNQGYKDGNAIDLAQSQLAIEDI